MPATDPKPSPSRRPGLIRRTLRRRWLGILAVWLLGTLAFGALGREYLRPTYRAISLIRVDPAATDLYNLKPAGEPLEPFIQTQVQLIASPNVLTAAGTNPRATKLERVQKAGDVVQELRKAVNVVVIPGTYLIEVSMTSPDGYEAATLVNAVVDAYMEANGEWSDGMTRVQIRNLEAYDVELRNQTDELERRWKTLAAKGDIDVQPNREPGKVALDAGQPEPDFRRSITMEEYRAVYKDLNQIKLDLAQAEAWLTTAKAVTEKGGKGEGPAAEQALIDKQVQRRFQLDPEVTALSAQMNDARSKLNDARRLADNPGDPAVKKAQSKLDDLTTQWNQLWDVKSAAIREQIELGRRNDMPSGQEIAEATTMVNKLRAKQVSLKKQFEMLDVKNKNAAADAVEIMLIQDERETLREMRVAVIRRLEQLRFEAKGEARVRPVNPNGAIVPGKPMSDPRPVIAAIPFVMLFVASSLFFAVEAISAPEDKTDPSEPPAVA